MSLVDEDVLTLVLFWPPVTLTLAITTIYGWYNILHLISPYVYTGSTSLKYMLELNSNILFFTPKCFMYSILHIFFTECT